MLQAKSMKMLYLMWNQYVWIFYTHKIAPNFQQKIIRLQLGILFGRNLWKTFSNTTLKLNIDSLSLVGFSAGAHLCSAAGISFQNASGNTKKIPRYDFMFMGNNITLVLHLGIVCCRITGLDPAGPSFVPFITAFLTEDDATFVDALHCDAGCYGLWYSGCASYRWFLRKFGYSIPAWM